MQQFLEFKNNHPVFFYSLFPITLIILIILYLSKTNTQEIKEDIRETEKQDAGLKQDAQHLNDQAHEHQAIAQKIEEQIQDVEVDSNWHKK